MSKKFQSHHLQVHITKYNFEQDKYVLPIFTSNNKTIFTYPQVHQCNLEPFKNSNITLVPSICYFDFMSESEIVEVKKTKSHKKLFCIFGKKLQQYVVKGLPKILLIEFLISIVKFSNRYLYETQQTGALLAIFYNTHLYFSFNPFATTEEIYSIFKKYICVHSISVLPNKIKLFEAKQAKQVTLYFCSIYLRNLPLIRLLMFPNYGLSLSFKVPQSEIEMHHGAKAKGGKKKGKK